MHDDTRKFVDRFKQTTFDVVAMAMVAYAKNTAELVTLAALFRYVGERFNSQAATVGYLVMTVALGLYVGNRIGLVISTLLAPRIPWARWQIAAVLSTQITLSVIVILVAKGIIDGVVLQLAQ